MTTILSVVLAAAALVDQGTGSGAGPAHPAPGFCVAQGGISSIYEGPEGQIGICRLPDNSLIEEMTLWRQASLHDPQEASAKFLQSSWHEESGAFETWADEYCTKAGGTVTSYTEYLRPTAAVKLCEFQDGSSVETWTLLSGPDTYMRLGAMLQTKN